ncbi:hypothetical protein DYST_03746 [Dyella terrae]|nr:hypothetical protein DYST_03746 [Dyella terrae]
MKYRKCVVLASLWLAGCAVGVNFTKPADDRLVVGASKEADVLAELGKPNFKSAKVVNGESLTMDTYAYAVGGSADGVLPGVTPARSLAVVFKDGLLVEKEYTSSFKTDATLFDVDKAKSIKPGMAMEEVKALLGNPSGEAVYPITSSQTSRGVLYSFTETKGFKSQRNMLLVEIDRDDRVTKSDFTQVGQL